MCCSSNTTGQTKIDEIHLALEEHQPFTSWKAVSRALDDIIDIVEWLRPDERYDSSSTKETDND